MEKTIHTLVDDIHSVIEGQGGWDESYAKWFSDEVFRISMERFSKPQEPRDYLGLSAIGTPCKRKLWYQVNMSEKQEPLPVRALGTFFYGDLIEAWILSLAMASGHKVEGMQDRLDVHGIKGHRDAVIDGVTVDVKSASAMAMSKFEKHAVKEDDPFGYYSQLSSYVYAGKDDPLVTDKTHGAFLVVQKDSFKLVLDMYDFSEELKNKEKEIEEIKSIVAHGDPPPRHKWNYYDYKTKTTKYAEDMPEWNSAKKDYTGNRKLSVGCRYCPFKDHCWPEKRTFLYKGKAPLELTVVKNTPRVPELK